MHEVSIGFLIGFLSNAIYFIIYLIMKRKYTRSDKKLTIYFLSGIVTLIGLIYLFVKGTGGFSWKIDPYVWGYFGSFIGGILLIVTILVQVRSFYIQQVENKFFEMIRYYRENVNEMKIKNPFHDHGEIETGRRVIKIIFDQYISARKTVSSYLLLKFKDQICPIDLAKDIDAEYLHSVNTFLVEKSFISKKVILSREHYEEKFFKVFEKRDIFKNNYLNYNFLVNEIAYLITYWGVPEDSTKDLSESLSSYESFIKDILEDVKKYPTAYSDFTSSILLNLHFRELPEFRNFLKTEPNCDEPYFKFFGGHQHRLGHYFRHLFQAVKYIDEQPRLVLSKKKKEDYVKLLRAQLSNYEQALLFINSLSKLGRNWEYSNKKGNNLITEYEMIKNLPPNFVPCMNPKYYYPGIEYEF